MWLSHVDFFFPILWKPHWYFKQLPSGRCISTNTQMRKKKMHLRLLVIPQRSFSINSIIQKRNMSYRTQHWRFLTSHVLILPFKPNCPPPPYTKSSSSPSSPLRKKFPLLRPEIPHHGTSNHLVENHWFWWGPTWVSKHPSMFSIFCKFYYFLNTLFCILIRLKNTFLTYVLHTACSELTDQFNNLQIL